MKRIKVLVIDDSALVRKVLSEILAADEMIDVVGTANDPVAAIKLIKEKKPDVLTLDLQMPKMDGLTFLKRLMVIHPLPVIVISSLTRQGSSETIKALELGALDFVAKPRVGINRGLEELAAEIRKKVKNGASIDRQKLTRQFKKDKLRDQAEVVSSSVDNNDRINSTIELIAIGASTGGTVAVRNILQKLPSNLPGIIVVLHMPKSFTASYAKNLDKSCSLRVKEVVDGEQLKSGTVYIAPGDQHLVLEGGINDYYLKLNDDPPVNYHRPAVDKTFASVADLVAPNCIGIILTGMGSDGAKGLKRMYDRGSFTIAQDEASSIVFGMPKQAIALGGVEQVLPLDQIASRIVELSVSD
ncbi:chemotaxis response regulator protein-glutamate methylesterase [Natroniella sulfidigena]|uniref:protein-glutamate methylesterase/protein-glutamine glutaminase n=1 Tax=Natroniella sulfidigena TaxID=723921 RepID=UPI00200A0132|nr:chemotaxis response regulator protein-glutamate methylesterase [Natroniella sulfidigena]